MIAGTPPSALTDELANDVAAVVDGEATSDLASVARGGALNLVGGAASAAFTFLFYVVVARSLETARAGALLVGIAVFTIASMAAQLGAHVGLVRTVPRSRVLGRAGDLRRVLLVALLPVAIVATLVAILVALSPGWLVDVFGRGADAEAAGHAIRTLAVFLPFSAVFAVAVAGTQGFGTMVPAVLVDKIGRTGAQFLGAIVATIGGATAFAVAWGLPYALGSVAALTWLLALVRRAQAGVPQHDHRRLRSLARRFWSFSAPRGVASLFQVTILWLDTILLAAFISTTDAAVYAVATRYLVLGHVAIAAVLQVMGPKISELLAKGDIDRVRTVYQRSTHWLMSLVWPMYLVVAFFSPQLLRVFGGDYVVADTALVVLASAMLVAVACGPVDVVLLMAGRSWWSLANWSIALVVNVGLNLVLIPRIGINGAALAWMASIVVRNVVPAVEVWFLLRLHPLGPGFARVALSGLVAFGGAGLVGRLIGASSWTAMLVCLAGAAVLYVALLWRFRDHLDFAVVRDVLRRPTGRRPADSRAG